MAAWQILKISRKTFFNPGAWLDVQEIKASNKVIWDSVSGLFVPETPTRKETFAEAVTRLGLTDHDVEEIRKNYQAFTWFFIGLGFFTLLFGFYLFFAHGTFSALILGIATTALFFGQAFRYSFWHFQIKNRKLGCTFQEWKSGKVADAGAT